MDGWAVPPLMTSAPRARVVNLCTGLGYPARVDQTSGSTSLPASLTYVSYSLSYLRASGSYSIMSPSYGYSLPHSYLMTSLLLVFTQMIFLWSDKCFGQRSPSSWPSLPVPPLLYCNTKGHSHITRRIWTYSNLLIQGYHSFQPFWALLLFESYSSLECCVKTHRLNQFLLASLVQTPVDSLVPTQSALMALNSVGIEPHLESRQHKWEELEVR